MGKSNRVRAEKSAASVLKVPAKKTKNNGSSKIYSIVIALVAVFVVATIVLSSIASSGVLLRNTKAMKSKNYTITGSMFKYMVLSEYDSFLTNYSSYLSYFSLDTSKPLDDQAYGTGNETAFLGQMASGATWLDFFVEPVKSQAEQILIYCELADEKGITLDDEDKANIDEAIALIEADALKSGYTLEVYVATLYGNGIKVKDLRKTMELSTLAGKAAEAVDEELLAGITADEVKAKYDANPKGYDVVEYVGYTIGVSLKTFAKDHLSGYDGKTDLTADQKNQLKGPYGEKIKELKDKAESFTEYKSAEEFIKDIILDVAKENFDSLYKTEALADADKIAEADLALVKDKMIESVIAEVNRGDDTTADDTVEKDGTYSAYGINLTANASKAVDNVKKNLFTAVSSAKETYVVKKQKYDENSEFAKWAFEADRKACASKLIYSGDDFKGEELNTDNGYFSADIYYIEAPQHPDTTLAKDVAYMTFATKDAAQKAIDAIKAGEKLTLERFEAVAKEQNAVSNGFFEDYLKGQVEYNGYEEWLYDENTLVGAYTQTPLANAATNATEYAIFFYVENGNEAWYIDVQNEIFVDDYQTYFSPLKEKYEVTELNDKVVAKLGI